MVDDASRKELSARVTACAGDLLYKATVPCIEVSSRKCKFPMKSTVFSAKKSYFCSRNTNQINSMAIIGYLPYLPKYAEGAADRKWMEDFGCDRIVEEKPEEGTYRMGWDTLLASIGKGDTLVVSKLAHAVKGARQLSFFLEFCRIKSVRLVAQHDGIDSGNELFPKTQTSDLLRVIAQLPEEANAVRKMTSQPGRWTKGTKVLSQAAYGRVERNKRVVNMYKSGYTIDDIWKTSGFRSRSSVFRVLKDAGVELKRKKR